MDFSVADFSYYRCIIVYHFHYVMFLCPVDAPIQCVASIPMVNVHWVQDQVLKFSTCYVTDWTIL